jgi:hypothetical protein
MTVRELAKILEQIPEQDAVVAIQGVLPELQEPMPRIIRYPYRVSYWCTDSEGRIDKFETIPAGALFVKL